MKAIAYTKKNGEHVIEIENGKSLTSSEALSHFITRTQDQFETDYLEDLEVDIVEAPVEKEIQVTEEKEIQVTEEKEIQVTEEKEIPVEEDLFTLARPPGRPEGRKDLAEVMEEAERAKVHKGKEISFVAYRTKKLMTGRIKYVWVDKREPMALYRIGLENGKEMNKVITSKDITIFD